MASLGSLKVIICSVLEFDVLERFNSVGEALGFGTRLLFPVTVKDSSLETWTFLNSQADSNGRTAAVAA